MNIKNKELNYKFTLVIKGVHEISTDLENTLYESGCDDTLIHSNNGAVFLEFGRFAKSLEEAVQTAIKDVEKSKIYEVAVVEPADFVTIAEIARRSKLSREYIRKLVKGERGTGGFPSPLAGTSSTTLIYSWVEVSAWLTENHILKTRKVLDNAVIIKQFNDRLNNKRQLLNRATTAAKV